MDKKAMYKIGYGLYVLTTKTGEKDNGCIVNSVIQVTNEPNRIILAVNKSNFTHSIITYTGLFNISVLSESTSQEIFTRFGYSSGSEKNKFDGFYDVLRSQNGIYYLTKHVNAYISGKVLRYEDLGSHTLFICDVTAAEVLGDERSVTYDYYQQNIKPASVSKSGGKSQWKCEICGYIYEGDELPPDFICPICKHGAADFTKIG